MKTTLQFVLIGLLLTACDLTIIEPRYDSVNAIVGSYKVEEYSNTYNSVTRFYFDIRRSYGRNVIIENFYDVGLSVNAWVDYDKIYIDRQIINGYAVEGVGTIYRNKIQFSYNVEDLYSNKPTDFCNATAWYDY
jgi:hypothetical protein